METPKILPSSQGDAYRPYWSVMIPTYNPHPEHFEQALHSVLMQDPGPERMQIEVVDDCSPDVDVAALVKRIAGDRVAFFRNVKNLGLAGCWNSCLDRASGVWVHILHQDDYVLPGCYERLRAAAISHPEVSFIVARCLIVDEHGVKTGVTSEISGLESGGQDVSNYLYENPFQCPGVVVRRALYEAHGGFRTDLTYTLDWEMWIRAIALSGGVSLPEVLASRRSTSESESTRLALDAETLYDRERLATLFAERFPTFDKKKAYQYIWGGAISEVMRFAKLGNDSAALANLQYYRRNASITFRLRHLIWRNLRKVARSL